MSVDAIFDVKTITELGGKLAVDKHNLDENLVEQAELFYHVCQLLSLWSVRRDACKDDHERLLATVDGEVREDLKASGEKSTEREVDSRKKLDDRVVASEEELLRFQHTVSRLQHLKEAYTQRGYVLKELTALHIAQYYSQDSAGEDKVRRQKIDEAIKREKPVTRQRAR